jgi:hypothetical protein
LKLSSRDDLPGLIAHDGARRIDLDVLSRPEALALLRTLIGVRADTEAADLAEIAERCSGLPLALRVLAERVITRPLDPLACLAAELSDERRRLDLLNGPDDPVTAVRAVFSWSVRHLTPAAAQAFRLLGLHPGQHIDDYALAALAGCDLASARFLLDQLVRAHLLQHAGPAG